MSDAAPHALKPLWGAGAGAGLLPAAGLLAGLVPLEPAPPPPPPAAVPVPLELLLLPSPPDMPAPAPAAKPNAEAPPVVVLASAWPCSAT